MMEANDKTKNNRKSDSYDTFNLQSMGETYSHLDKSDQRHERSKMVLEGSLRIFPQMSPTLIPGNFEDNNDERDTLGVKRESKIDGIKRNRSRPRDRSSPRRHQRSFRRRLFLFLTEPSSSWLSAVFFVLLIVAISVSNLIIIMQTMSSFQYRPTECKFCAKDGGFYDGFKDSNNATSYGSESVVECMCPLRPYPYLERVLGFIMIFFAVEWTLRVLSYVPAHPRSGMIDQWGSWFIYLTSPSTLLDALAIWPYYIERYDLPGLISLRLLRLLRVFQIFRLGTYNSLFVSLTSVLFKSIGFLKLLIVILFFGATIFGSLLFWLEQGQWKYWEPTGDFQYVRMSIDGKNEEISPFSSIPAAFWWFVVTATTVGYGDYYPTSTAGQWVSVCAMLTGVLVIALPVSVFSDLWSEELKEVKGLESLFEDDSSSSSSDNENYGGNVNPEQEYGETISRLDAQFSRNEYQKINFEEDFHHNSSTHVVMEREDLDEIVSSIRSIHEQQRRIQRILKKYRIHEDDRH